jgi:hypothetical protein
VVIVVLPVKAAGVTELGAGSVFIANVKPVTEDSITPERPETASNAYLLPESEN